MLKSSSVEQIKPPIIVGNKYASDGEKYSTNVNATENVLWLLFGNNTSYGTHDNNNFDVDFSSFSKGIYVVYINKGDENIYTNKIVKQ